MYACNLEGKGKVIKKKKKRTPLGTFLDKNVN